MPAQELGFKDDDLKLITANSTTGSIVNSFTLSTADQSPTSDSVDGSIHSESGINSEIKALETLQAALDNIQRGGLNNEGAGDAPASFCGTEDSLSSLDNNLLSSGSESHDRVTKLDTGGTVTVPPIVRLETRTTQENTRVLGKRPAAVAVPHNSVVNKVIITKNPNTSQPQAVPIQIQTLPITHTQTLQNVSVAPNISYSPRTPTKTITISQQGIVSPLKGITMAQVAGTPPKLPISKLPISPAKTPTKITMIPVQTRSPQQKITVSGHTLLGNSVSNVQTTITMSPSKVIKQPGTVHVIQKPIQPSLGNASVVTLPAAASMSAQSQGLRQVAIQPGNIQQIHVPGNKFHYIRLATPTTSSQGVRGQIIQQARAGIPTSIVTGQSAQQMKISIPTQAGAQIINHRPAASTVQRVILPAAPTQISIRAPTTGTTTGTQVIRSSLPTGAGNLAQIAAGPAGTTFISAGGNTPGVQGYALVPASYLSQIQQQIQVKPVTTTATVVQSGTTTAVTQSQNRSDYVPIASSNPSVSASTQKSSSSVNGSSLDASGGARPRKPCNCTKSQCLKLYCDCFANGEFCHNCNCMNCANNLTHEEERYRAIKACLERNPQAFHPKIGKGKAGEKDRRHNKGCNCKRSGCLKNYCECYEAKIMCSSHCKCVGCKNFEESPERKTLMHLADAAEVRVQQQTAAKTKLSSQISDLPTRPSTLGSGERLPFSFVTNEVVEATCACLLAQSEDAERAKMPHVMQERMVMEEFGHCLKQIIESANKTKANDPEDAT